MTVKEFIKAMERSNITDDTELVVLVGEDEYSIIDKKFDFSKADKVYLMVD